MKLQQLLSLTRQAIDEYNMIHDGDKIAIGISGGKDSLTLLYALSHLQRFYPKHFELCAITVDLGFENINLTKIAELCKQLNVAYHVVTTDIAKIIFEDRKESNPCSLCAKMRKGALNQKVKELGFNKVAFAHHKDDMIETFLMSLFYEGRIHSCSPMTYWDRSQITLIRPLIYVTEGQVIRFTEDNELPVLKSACPVDGHTKREYIKTLIKELSNQEPKIQDRVFTAILNGNLSGWPVRNENPRGQKNK
ncbi:MAG: tRNA 2-thiocytidine biosynthesis protein TtcA [Lachnospiraceae bacterium]|nr:tRNA 2-thiocytidine biosynthesis protein TtcA [Lachnospiraceae bacterium]